MRVFLRRNHVGWIHLWRSRAAFEAGEPSEHFFDPRIDPRWASVALTHAQREALARGEGVEVEDPGYLEDASGSEDSWADSAH